METDEFDILFNRSKGIFQRWKVSLQSRITNGSELLLYTIEGKTDRIRSPIVGTILWLAELAEGEELRQGQKVAVVAGCDHSVVMKDMCADCGKNLRTKEGLPGELEHSTGANVAVLHSIPELRIAEDHAITLSEAETLRLLKSKRLVLLVDLDQTLIHTTTDDVDASVKDVEHFQLGGKDSAWYHTRLRPHAREFLQRISQFYELHICTFGVRLYAHYIARVLDPRGNLFGQRILSRDECFDPFSKTANLKALFPTGDNLVCIIDDREDVWQNAPNMIHVKPYRFFKHTGDINAPPGFGKSDERTPEDALAGLPDPEKQQAGSANGGTSSIAEEHADVEDTDDYCRN